MEASITPVTDVKKAEVASGYTSRQAEIGSIRIPIARHSGEMYSLFGCQRLATAIAVAAVQRARMEGQTHNDRNSMGHSYFLLFVSNSNGFVILGGITTLAYWMYHCSSMCKFVLRLGTA